MIVVTSNNGKLYIIIQWRVCRLRGQAIAMMMMIMIIFSYMSLGKSSSSIAGIVIDHN